MANRTLVLPDIHLRWRQVDQILGWEDFDRVILLGDYFDMFEDFPAQNKETAGWLKSKLDDPTFICLQGNHDSSYRWPGNEFAYASGFSWQKNKAIREVLDDNDFAKLRPCWVEQNILFTHAGVDKHWLPLLGLEDDKEVTAAKIGAAIEVMWPTICKSFASYGSHPLLGVGFERNGWQEFGGITWQDFTCHHPIKGVKQIVGHTKQEHIKGPLFRTHGTPCWKLASKTQQKHLEEGRWTLCLDTALHHYVILEDSKLTIKSVVWKRPYGQEHFHVQKGQVVCEVQLQ